jgi:IstB-like ATP binding protein
VAFGLTPRYFTKEPRYESDEPPQAARGRFPSDNRIWYAAFPLLKNVGAFDFTATLTLSKQSVLELARGAWIEHRFNCCLIGGSGGRQDPGRHGVKVGPAPAGQAGAVFTVVGLVTQLEEAHHPQPDVRE